MNKNNLIALLLILGYCAPGLAAIDTEAPRIVHEPCEEYQVGPPFELWARFYDDSPITETAAFQDVFFLIFLVRSSHFGPLYGRESD